jgi:hypothetical protein
MSEKVVGMVALVNNNQHLAALCTCQPLHSLPQPAMTASAQQGTKIWANNNKQGRRITQHSSKQANRAVLAGCTVAGRPQGDTPLAAIRHAAVSIIPPHSDVL